MSIASRMSGGMLNSIGLKGTADEKAAPAAVSHVRCFGVLVMVVGHVPVASAGCRLWRRSLRGY